MADDILLEMTRGDSFVLEVDFTDDMGVPVDDATATYRMTAKNVETDPDPGVFSVTSTQYAPGKALITVPPAATSGLPTRVLSLVYDIQVTETSGRITTVQSGALIVEPDISRVTP